MDRISTTNKAIDLFGAGKHGFKDGDLALGIIPTEFSAAWVNGVQEELLAIIEAAGIVPAAGTRNQILTALRSAGVHQTPAQFDNSTKAATTAYVRRALGNYVFVPLNTSTTLTAADAGTCYDWYATANGTITLPAISALSAGAAFKFQNISAYNLTISPAGADVLYQGNTSVASIVIGPGDCLEIAHDSVRWISLGGSAALKGASVFGSSLTTNGYQKLPSGLIIQWGNATTNASGVATVTLPIAFPNNALLAVTTDLETAAANVCYGGATFNGTLTTLTLTYAKGGAAANAGNAYWFAMGN